MSNIPFVFVMPENTVPEPGRLQPASYLRRNFNLEVQPVRATLYTTGLGVFQPFVNGMEADKARLMPGFTNYHKRVQYFASDVTELLHKGENVMAAILGDGWYRGCMGAFSQRAFYGERLLFAAALEIVTAGETLWIYTDEQTKATQNGPIRGNDLKTFEIVDMTRELPGWNAPGYDDSGWHSCKIGSYDGEVAPLQGERVTEHEHFTPRVLTTPNGETVLDFGQNLAGHVAFTVTGRAGTRVMLEMGETLDENGNFTVKNLYGNGEEENVSGLVIQEGMEIPKNVLGQTLVYTLKDGRQTYKSTFLQSGFRYVRLSGWPEPICPENFTAIAVYADIPYTGSFRCSDDRINQLVSNVRWSQKSNFVDIPTDCPTRERAGWAGDVNVYSETACYLADTRRFLKKWLQDFLTLQKPDGSLPFIAPEVPLTTEGIDMMNLPYSSAGWSDALIHVPMVLYRFYGDREILELVYEAAGKYVEFNCNRAKQKHKLHFYKIGKHYKYILDTGYHWGEWLEPGTSMAAQAIRAITFPDAEVATAWFYYSVHEMAEMADILGKEADKQKYSALAGKIKAAYVKEFLRGGRAHGKRQCRYVRPLSMGLADGKAAQRIADQLNKLCIRNSYKIGTGFLTTWQVLQVLSDYGHADTAYRMLTQPDCPGWMYEIGKGATTIWENWMGIDEAGVPRDSQNHYAMGAVISWLFSRVGGLTPLEPGFTKVKIAPLPVGDLSWAETEYSCDLGTIFTRWERKGKDFTLKISLPDGMSAVVKMPDGTVHSVCNHKELNCTLTQASELT